MDAQTLLAHGDFVRTVVRRLLRDEHQVDDVLQDTWLAALRSPPGRRGALRAWLARVARNRALSVARADRRRFRREAAAARPEPVPDATERLVRSREVVEAVLALPEPFRTTVVQRFFEGRSTADVARRQGVSEVTIRSRVRGALERLREHFDRRHARARWQAMLVPLAAATTPARAAAAVAAGGLAMKTTLIVLAAVAAGVAIGWVASPVERSSRRAVNPDAVLAGHPAHQSLREDHAALQRRVEELERRNADLLARVEAKGAPDVAAGARGRARTDGVDWAALEKLIETHRATIGRMAKLEREGKGPRSLTPDEAAGLQQLLLGWTSAAAQARTVTPHPILDPRFLPHLMNSLLGGAVGITDGQKERLEREVLAVLAAHTLPADPTPLQAHLARRAVMAQVADRIGLVLDAAQRAEWQEVAPLWRDLEKGDQRAVTLGLRTGASLRERVLNELSAHYRVTGEEQQAHVEGVVDRYLDEARAVLRQHGQLGDSKAELDDAGRRRLEESFLELQGRMEAEILPRLTPEQRANLGRQLPVLIDFADNGSININQDDDRGF